METRNKELREYLTKKGNSPFGEWLNSLKDIKARAKLRVRLDRLKLGNLGDCKSLGSGVKELRIDFGPGYRIYFGQDGDVIILLLCGGTKKFQTKDIRRAKEYWQDYKERKQYG
jgi:putative addiction module killer protein